MIIQKVCFYTYLFLQSMKEMEMDYVNVQKESIDKGVEAMSLEGPKNSLRFCTTKGPWQRTGIVLVIVVTMSCKKYTMDVHVYL